MSPRSCSTHGAQYAALFVLWAVAFGIGAAALGIKLSRFLPAFLLLYVAAGAIYFLGLWDQAAHYNLEPPLVALGLGLLVSNTVGRAALARAGSARRVLHQDRHRAAGREPAADADRLGGPGGHRAGRASSRWSPSASSISPRVRLGARPAAGGDPGHGRRGVRRIGRHRHRRRRGRQEGTGVGRHLAGGRLGHRDDLRAAAGRAQLCICPPASPAPGSAPRNLPMPPVSRRRRPTAAMPATCRASPGNADAAVSAFTLMKVIGRDVWIGVWAFVLSLIATTRWERTGVQSSRTPAKSGAAFRSSCWVSWSPPPSSRWCRGATTMPRYKKEVLPGLVAPLQALAHLGVHVRLS